MSELTKLDSITFDRYLKEHNPFEAGSCVFDLTGITFMSPAALVQLTAACHALHRDGRQPVLIIPDPDVRSYLLRTAFFSTLDGVAEIQPYLPKARTRLFDDRLGTNPMLIEVTKIESSKALPEVLDRVVQVLRRRLKYHKPEAFDVATAVSELSQNTFDHNAQTCGFLAMQGYGRGATRFLEIAVADYGCGLAATLARNPRNPKVHSDAAAIQLAIKPGVSEHDDATRGTGLHHLLEITYRLKGSVHIRSGQGKVVFRGDKQQGWVFSVPRVPGVQVSLALSTRAAA